MEPGGMECFHASDEQMDAFVLSFIGKLPEHLQRALCPNLVAVRGV